MLGGVTMNNWVDIASIVASLATFGALLAVAFEVRNSTRAEQREASFQISKRWKELGKARQLIREMSWIDMEDFTKKYEETAKNQHIRSAFVEIMEFFETIGASTFNKHLDQKLIFSLLGSEADRIWGKFQERVEFLRKELDSVQTLLHFEWFALEARKAEPQVGKELFNATEALRKEAAQ
jgi:hypothetical protein